MRGAAHIVRLIADRDAEERIGSGPPHITQSLIGLMEPVILMEYLENGSVDRLQNMMRRHEIMLPNRVLWSFFLCSRFKPKSEIP